LVDDQGQFRAACRVRTASGLKDAGAIAPNTRVPRRLYASVRPEAEAAEVLPPHSGELRGENEVRVVNPNAFVAEVGLRSVKGGRDFKVPAQGRESVFVPDGDYDIFFIFSSEPAALYRGDSFSLRSNGVEIQIVKVAGGNYSIRRVR
jgi:hypothetical protein